MFTEYSVTNVLDIRLTKIKEISYIQKNRKIDKLYNTYQVRECLFYVRPNDLCVLTRVGI